MSAKTFKGSIISDFNADNLSNTLNYDPSLPKVETVRSEFGQVQAVLMDKHSAYWKNSPDFLVVWTLPEGVIGSFKDVLNFDPVPMDVIYREVDEFSRAILNAADKVKNIFVPAWVASASERGYGLLDMKPETGITDIVARMNLRLSENLKKASNIYILNSQKWMETAGKSAYNPKLWYMGKIPFSQDIFKIAGQEIKSALRTIHGRSRKIILLDLDDTLWGGIVGDDGWKDLRLGGHDPMGEAYQDFQQALKALKNRGILLGLVSKNDEKTALEAIEKNPEMVLRSDDLAGWRINWNDKAQSIVELAEELNLGLQSVVFIDENPMERARVAQALPEVLVPEWPENPMLFKSALLNLSCFDSIGISAEDKGRTKLYADERRRKNLSGQMSLEEWVKTLGIVITIEELSDVNLKRAAQLFNKTNQMNLATRRLTENELMQWAKAEGHKVWTFRVADKFGDSGLTGLVSVKVDKQAASIYDFVLSCRVMGRKLEEAMVYKALQHVRSSGIPQLTAQYIATAKNNPCLEFWKRSGFKESQNIFTPLEKATDLNQGLSLTGFTWKTSQDYPAPAGITIEDMSPSLKETHGRA